MKMNIFKKILSYLLYGEKRKWDFEGRCYECKRTLNLMVVVIKNNKILLSVESCKEHPGSELILWPQRNDVYRIEKVKK